MKVFRILGRNIRDAFRSVGRNFSLSIASIICTTITLILLAVAIVVSYNVNAFAKDLEKELVVVVFVEKDATIEEIGMLESKIKSINNIDKITYISNEEEKERIKGENEILDSIMSSFDAESNPLLNRFDLKVKDANEIPSNVKEIREFDKVNAVKYGESVVEKILPVFNIVEKATLVIVIALVFVTAFLISNTIKITIFARRTEIEIMRLVGTNNLVIRLPFLFEGFIIGVLGAIIPVGITIYGYIFAYDKLGGYIFSNLIKLANPMPFILYVAAILLIIGAVVGMIGSYRAVRRYLKV